MIIRSAFSTDVTHRLQGCRRWLRVALIAYILSFCHFTIAADHDSVLIIHDGKNELVQDIIQSFSVHFSNKLLRFDLLDITTQALPDDNALKSYTSLITLGTQATQITIERNPPAASISLLLSKQAWALINQQKSTYPRSVIVFDQPISRQLQLIREVYGRDAHTGVLLGPYTESLQTELQEQAKQQQQLLTIKVIQNEDELIPALNNLVEQIDLLLAEPDPLVYNKRSIQGILLLTYRNKTPVIGFSQAYSRAGAMVSLHSSVEDMAQQAAEIIFDKPVTGRVYSPKYFTISYNQQVARALSYTLPDEKELIERIVQKEKTQP